LGHSGWPKQSDLFLEIRNKVTYEVAAEPFEVILDNIDIGLDSLLLFTLLELLLNVLVD
jgi:hypothetical protein